MKSGSTKAKPASTTGRAKGTPKGTHNDKRGWKAQLQEILDEHAGTRDNGNVAAFRTRDQACTMLFACFRTLREVLGFRIENPHNLNEMHIAALVGHWYRNDRAVTTMRQNLSLLRKFSRWIGKPGMVKELPAYLPHVERSDLRTTSVLKVSKSWSENGIDIDAKIAEADALSEKFGLMLRIAIAFGLRKRELVMLHPWKADGGDVLTVFATAGPKTGRARVYRINTRFKREMLDYVKQQTPKTHHLGWYFTRRGKPATLKYNESEYQRRLEEIGITKKMAGVTGHGLRAENAENQKLERGVLPATLGGDGSELPPDEMDVVEQQISENLGHSRTSVTTSYYGSYARVLGGVRRVKKKPDPAERRSMSARTIRPIANGTDGEAKSPAERRALLRKRKEMRLSTERIDTRQMHLPLNGSVTLFPVRARKAKSD